MRRKIGFLKFRKLAAVLAVATTAIGSIAAGLPLNTITAKAAENEQSKEVQTEQGVSQQAIEEVSVASNTPTPTVVPSINDTVDLRMVFTTDLHGQLSSMDYLSGTDFKNAGLSRAYPLIVKTREELPASNVFTFDVGDVLFEASMEYIYGQDEEAIQPIYQGMALVGYDAITLGNHDFDYGKEYILRQLTYSGLLDKVVVSNLQNAREDSYPFNRNMIIERDAVTSDGKTMKVKVGVIGETIPTLSTKTDNYAGIWKTEDIVANVTKEAALLKEQGADIIVVLAHSGFGAETPAENADNTSYALTKIDDVDVILCGHEHNEFPSTDKSSSYYQLPGVDANTSLVNGKLIVMAKSMGKSIGVADLTLGYDTNGDLIIKNQAGSVRSVANYKLEESQAILDCFSDWKEELEVYRTKQLIELADGVTLQNYLGLFGDSEVLQLQNDARIAYARKYIETVATDYAGYPVIAAASHISYGANSQDDFVNIKGSISYADLFTVQNYRNYTYIYKITGAQLKEWMELSASAYTTLSANSTNNQFLINTDWMENWSKFFVFDGISYSISPYIEPRYDINGKKINNTNRVSNVTYNGKPVTDDMELVIACNTISATGMFSWASSQQIKGMYRTQLIIADYLQSLSKFGKYTPTVDNNWKLALVNKQPFFALLPSQALPFAKQYEMFDSIKFETGDKSLVSFKAKPVTASEPHVVALQSVLDPTKKSYDVYVDAFSSSGIKKIYYDKQYRDVNDSYWRYDGNVNKVQNNKFPVFFNGTYTIYVEDNAGNKVTYYVKIDNLDSSEMAAPKVWSFNNTKTAVTGRAESGAMIYVEIGDKVYKKKANDDGSYSVSVPAQIAGTSFYVYAEDPTSNGKRKSGKTKVYVKYSAPNIISVDEYYNNSQYLTGKTNDEKTFVVIVDENSRTAYVSEAGASDIVRESTEIKLENFVLTEVPQIIDGEGNFKISLPNIEIGTSLRVVNMDHIGRVGVSSYITIKEGGPYAPEFFSTVDAENVIYGNVESVTSDKNLTVVVTVDGIEHPVIADQKGNFKVNLSSPLTEGMVISAYAKDIKKNVNRISKVASIKVASITTLERSEDVTISTTAYNSSSFTVTYLPSKSIVVSVPYATGTRLVKGTTNLNGNLTIKLTEELAEGSLVKMTCRNNLGKITAASYSLVTYRKPAQPVLLTTLTNNSTYMKIMTDKNYPLYVTINGQEYYSEKGVYKSEYNGYVHVIKFDRLPTGTSVSMYSKNVTTNSDTLKLIVEKKAPDVPDPLYVKVLEDGKYQVRGKVELFLLNSEKKPTLELTKTKVFARVDGVNYTGVVNKNGIFKIDLPELKEGTIIYVYAYNRYGYGPETQLVVPVTVEPQSL